MKGPDFDKLRQASFSDLWAEIEHRIDAGPTPEPFARVPFTKRLAVYATVLVLTIVTVSFAANALRTGSRRVPAAGTATSATASKVAATTAASDARVDIPVGGQPTAIAAGQSGTWVADATGLVRIDPATNEVAAAVSAPSEITSIAVGSDAIWATDSSSGSVLRADPESGGVKTVAVGENPTDVALGENGLVWVVSHNDGRLVRVDPVTGEVVATEPIAGELTTLAVGGGAIWVASDLEAAIYEVNADKGAVVGDPIPIPGRVALTFAEGRLWVASTSGYLSVVDPSTHQVLARIQFASEGLASDFVDATFDGTHVWVMKSAPDNVTTIAQVDADTGKVLSTSEVPFGATSLVSSDGSLWLLPAGGQAVVRIPQ